VRGPAGPGPGGTPVPGRPAAHGARPACDPRLPPAFRRWAARQRPVFHPDGRIAVIVPGGSSGGIGPVTVCCWVLALVCAIAALTGLLPAAGTGWLAAAVTMVASAAALRYRAGRRDLRLCRSAVVFPESLDPACRSVLARAQNAVDAVLGSSVRAAGLLGSPVDDTTLFQHEWEIARKLREITRFRALLAENTRGTRAGSMTTEVLGGHQRAIDLAQEAVTARVAALEHYAREIRTADDADRDWQQATRLSQLNNGYLELAAGAASDDYATGEIANLTEQLSVAAQERDERLCDADLAAEALILPEPRTGELRVQRARS